MNRNSFTVCLTILLAVLGTVSAFAQTLTIAQVDASPLLLSQTVDLYVSVTDGEGNPIARIAPKNFSVFESSDGEDFVPVSKVTSVVESPHKTEGIQILLLVDNSGSMYDTLWGKPTDDTELMRTTYARNAIRTFIGASFNPEDRIALASFNTSVTVHDENIADPAALNGILKEIRRPEQKEAYTELYHALVESVEPVGTRQGRRVVVVLSDGENYPYYTHAKEAHPKYGTTLSSPEDVVDSYQRDGVTLYAINFGPERDRNLGNIALQTGGNVYDARNEAELAGIYRDIRRKIDGEYRVSYRAGMFASDRTFVKVALRGAGVNRVKGEATRFYYSSTMFGIPVDPFPYWILLMIPAAIVVWFLLLVIRYRKFHERAALQVLQTGYGTKVSSNTVVLTQEKTVIGGGERADLTISGRGAPREEEVTIVFDEKGKSGEGGSYTIVGGGPGITVNNQPVTGKRRLSGGDVVNIHGTTIVFEEPDGKA